MQPGTCINMNEVLEMFSSFLEFHWCGLDDWKKKKKEL